jgi:hypothetical protein
MSPLEGLALLDLEDLGAGDRTWSKRGQGMRRLGDLGKQGGARVVTLVHKGGWGGEPWPSGGGGDRGVGRVESSGGDVLGNARARGIENGPWGRDWRRGGSAMPRWRGGGRVVEHHVVAVLALPFPTTTLARSARTRAPSLPGHVVLPESDGPMPFSTRKGAWVGRVPAARRGRGERGG